ncbi:MAG TPA: alpha-L-fucosidase, partial [Verrucomicrobiales bacterium]|nr:alpha-L-fucosidase [Verrucomicrobiales bacterium]
GEDGPTDTRLKRLAGAAPDLGLEGLFFQYGRYLLIAGSREDSPLPLHLQGLWNDGLAAEMGWTCDYHLDINTEQNYWPSEVANLAECGEPLFRFVESLQTPGRRTARAVYGIDRGWVCHVFSNPWGFTSPGWGRGWGLHVTGGAWVATHLWEHYRFTGDRRFLAQRAYPVLKGAAEFFLDYLYPDPATGFLVTGPSVSPERGGEAGPAAVHDRGVVAELFDACIEASRLLGVDAAWRARVAEARRRLPPYEVGRNGQLLEWVGKDDGGETNHRHTSHLVGLAPFGQITPRGTPELARAARRSLELRMGRKDWEDVEWSAGNSLCYFARLGAGEEAHQALVNLLTQDSDLNLMTYSRGGIAGATENIFAIDGNTSGTLGVAEMLVQSHAGEIDLLPALPEAWSEGEVQGLRARGGEIVDIAWRDRKVARYRITSVNSTPVKVRLNGAVVLAQPVRP